jgi:alanine-glyoxylate transaminase / serine-glyoxylate transaminase / serine-pyruvate transaminase
VPTESEHSASLTAVRLPEGHSADALRAEILARCNMSLGNGLGQLADRVFRIGHLGDFNDHRHRRHHRDRDGAGRAGHPAQPGAALAAQRSLLGNTGPDAQAAECGPPDR